jgi:hypothetical protein
LCENGHRNPLLKFKHWKEKDMGRELWKRAETTLAPDGLLLLLLLFGWLVG